MPLLHAITADVLNWPVQDKINKGELKGIQLGNGDEVCTKIFSDDTNALVYNEDISIGSFWECLQTFCNAARSVLNHNKIGMVSVACFTFSI